MKNLNIHADIRELSETLFADSIAAAMESRGLRWSPYVTGNAGSDDVVLDETSSDAKMGDTSVGLSQATRGIRLADQHWQRRVATGLTMVQALVQTAADNAKLVHDTVERARADFISSDEDIVITDYAKATNISWPFIDVTNGSIVDVPVTFMNTTPVTANLTRSRPQAYVFSRAWHDVADRLQAAGVVVDELYGDFEGQVEALNVTSSTVATSKYEGVVRTTVTTESVSKGVKIPAGGYWVSTRQKNAAHAFNVLEPENIDSYVTFNILPVDVGDEYQVYRVPV
ncbi:Carboxypeptidase 2 like protein [Verticillium longisporum]|uniref:Carboxypeptidase 2 like protein n=1 Tax=Verticillium longisporum TaxID=100787 RepID=A0A8I2Z4J1_VERLO|nr:Carboxypeptidase 2 like protein [Verticillium longisporum]